MNSPTSAIPDPTGDRRGATALPAIGQVEIPAADPKAASKFYADVFGWQINFAEPFDCHMFSAGNGPGGGWVSTTGEHATKPSAVLNLRSDPTGNRIGLFQYVQQG